MLNMESVMSHYKSIQMLLHHPPQKFSSNSQRQFLNRCVLEEYYMATGRLTALLASMLHFIFYIATGKKSAGWYKTGE